MGTRFKLIKGANGDAYVQGNLEAAIEEAEALTIWVDRTNDGLFTVNTDNYDNVPIENCNYWGRGVTEEEATRYAIGAMLAPEGIENYKEEHRATVVPDKPTEPDKASLSEIFEQCWHSNPSAVIKAIIEKLEGP